VVILLFTGVKPGGIVFLEGFFQIVITSNVYTL